MIERSGFTVVELIVAMTVIAATSALAMGVWQGTNAAVEDTRRSIQQTERTGIRHAWLRRTFGAMRIRSRPPSGLTGVDRQRGPVESDSLAFRSLDWERDRVVERSVTITFDGIAVIAVLQPGWFGQGQVTLTLADSVLWFGVDYLQNYGADAQWLHGWTSPATAPLGVRLRVGYLDARADTMFFHIGTRG